jgi:hypothetical protein
MVVQDRRSDPPTSSAAGRAMGENPQEDWGEPADEGAAYSANHTRRGVKSAALSGQGKKTRAATKDQISRRG